VDFTVSNVTRKRFVYRDFLGSQCLALINNALVLTVSTKANFRMGFLMCGTISNF